MPVEFLKWVINNNCFDFFYYREDAIDSEKLLTLINDAFKYDLTGYIGEIKTVDNNHIELSIE
ncbi:MAG: hypothetical protein Q4E31_12130 [Intestinibacter bartlettii]|uniref:hypothetical protein n=1 Tax=Intestinibacter bartlettii TaxID=261299 RepID=UPI0026ED561E|nr:hypothetical protein [Intestinibacter bartlettii]MDO5011566.1 hypothetical protein [Intestinibacter bartlettii]